MGLVQCCSNSLTLSGSKNRQLLVFFYYKLRLNIMFSVYAFVKKCRMNSTLELLWNLFMKNWILFDCIVYCSILIITS
jgi:hypothetical protein